MTTRKPSVAPGHPTKEYVRKQHARSFNLDKGDLELLAWCGEFLGCSKTEVVRTAIRAYAMSLENMSRTSART